MSSCGDVCRYYFLSSLFAASSFFECFRVFIEFALPVGDMWTYIIFCVKINGWAIKMV